MDSGTDNVPDVKLAPGTLGDVVEEWLDHVLEFCLHADGKKILLGAPRNTQGGERKYELAEERFTGWFVS